MAARIKKGDMVEVRIGRDAAAGSGHRVRGEVLRVMEDSDRIVVEGVNQVIRHMRATRRNQQGGRVQKEAPIAVSNAMPICPRCDRGVRIRFTIDDQGVKARTCAKCGTVIGSVAPLRSE